MADLILHHFLASPFSEKIRRVLAFKQLNFKSVLVPSVMPKPDVVALTGGYRKTPFLQIGADIYCDSALICDVLEALQPAPSLYPAGRQALARILGQWADTTLFWAAVTYNRRTKGAFHGLGDVPGGLPPTIFEDRKAMGFDIEWVQPADASPAYRGYLHGLDELLQASAFLLGQRPCLADFCAFHPIWLAHLRAPTREDLLQQTPALNAWVDRMQAIGLAQWDEVDASSAIAVAVKNQPAEFENNLLPPGRFDCEYGVEIGSPVKIMAESFARSPPTES